ncbi:MAG: GNAT family N-acetyltransferase [Candidatus Thorarchaeota archaeon]|nr:GNAT family N-acetyltransferase [Candidatus Thorarchaeota archaeon]
MIHNENISIETGYQDMYDDMAKLYNAVSGWDNPDHADLDGEFFRNSYHHLRLDLKENVITARTIDGMLIGIATWRPERSNPEEAYITGMVHPEFRERGIGTKLLGELERLSSKNAIKIMTCNIPSYQEYSISFIAHRGFKRISEWLKLSHPDLSRIKRPDTVEGFTLREMKNTDAKIWADMQNLIFHGNYQYQDASEADFTTIRNRPDYDPELFLLGLVDGRPAAYCLGLVFAPSTEDQKRRVLIQGIGVLPEYRGHGFGKTILEEVLWRAYKKGIEISELVVNESAMPARKMYESIGYEEHYGRIWYSKDLSREEASQLFKNKE